jgi:hypothetical protein
MWELTSHHNSGQLVAHGPLSPAAPKATDHGPEIPTGQFTAHSSNPVTTLARTDEPVWWWLTMLGPRAGLMLLLWATRNPQNGKVAALVLGAFALSAVLTGMWS